MKINKEVTVAGRFRRYIAMMSGNRRVLFGGLIAVGALLYAVSYMRDHSVRALLHRCDEAVRARSDTAVEVCRDGYGETHSPALLAKLARALQRKGADLTTLEGMAAHVGDDPVGADAWLALGLAYERVNRPDEALAAFRHAARIRPADDAFGRMSDAVAQMKHFREGDDMQLAVEQAAAAYEMAHLIAPSERAATLINIAIFMLQMGNPEIASEILEEAQPIPEALAGYVPVAQGYLDLAEGHPKLGAQQLRRAREYAHRIDKRDVEWDVRCGQVEAALLDGALDQAAALLHGMPVAPDASPADKAADSYYRAWFALADRRFADAVRIAEAALPTVPPTWISWLEATRGRALLEMGALDRADLALRHAISEIERKRDALASDTLRGWMFARMRAPYEDLVRLYAARNRRNHQDYTAEVFEIVQQATARSVLDGLVLAQHAPSTAQPQPPMLQWAAGMKKLAHSLRASSRTAVPSTQQILSRLHGNHVITYFRAGDQLWAIVVWGNGKLTMRSLGDAAALADKAAKTLDDALADELGPALLPDDILPARGVPIYIVADPSVAGLSFAALRTGGEYLVAQHPIAYGPSASVLASAPRSAAPSHAIVMGDPKGNLPGAREEALKVASKLNVEPMIGAAATTGAVLSANRATLVHIAAHTISTPMGRAVQLSDGALDAATIIDRGVTAGALVLLTCSSAAPSSNDEMAPLASAFLAAGANTVVASRWAIEDDIATEFAAAFYGANGATDPVRAVAAAQLALISNQVSVTQWSSFIVLGGIH